MPSCGYEEYLPLRIPTLNDFLAERIKKVGFRSYFPVGFDSDNGLLGCLGFEMYIPHDRLFLVLTGKLSEFDTDAMGFRVRLKRY